MATPNNVNLHRVLRCPPDRLYRAFLDPAALVKWMPPHGYTATVHSIDPKVGGGYKMSFTNFRTGHSHSFGGTYAELTPNSRLRYTDKFDDPNMPGEMSMTISLRPIEAGGATMTELRILQENIPPQIPAEMCYLGWQESLTLLTKLVEAEVP
ncbi:MAG: SRPBCC family protein [Phycisphaerales bacterium]